MKQFLVATMLTIGSFTHVALADTTIKQAKGVVKSEFPSIINVIDSKGQSQTYHYAPMGGPNVVELYYTDSHQVYVTVAGQGRSMCMNNKLGHLVGEINISYVAEGSTVSQELQIPQSSLVLSTCRRGSHDASDMTFVIQAK